MTKPELLRLMRYTDKDGIERYHKKLDSLRRIVEAGIFDGHTLDVIARQVEMVLSAERAKKRR